MAKQCRAPGHALEALLDLATSVSAATNGVASGLARNAALDQLNQALRELEGCSELFPGAVRLLRAQWFPECAAEIAASALDARASSLTSEVRLALFGTAVGAQSQRATSPMPRYEGDFDAPRFERFLAMKVKPWQTQVSSQLEAWESLALRLPAGTYGRFAALLGVAGSWREFIRLHTASPIPTAIRRLQDRRARYYGALQEEREPYERHLQALLPSVGDEFVVHGEYGRTAVVTTYQKLFRDRGEPLPWLAVPELDPDIAAVPARLASRVSLPVSLWLLGADPWNRSEVLNALLRQGLPYVVRSSVSKRLAAAGGAASEAAKLHGLLAAGLVRLGLISRDRQLFARAEQELQLAPKTPELELLSTLAGSLSRSGSARFVELPVRSPPGSIDDVSEFSNERNVAAVSSLDRMRQLNLALLRLTATPSDDLLRILSSLARAPELPEAYRRCLREGLNLCGGIFLADRLGARGQGACDCDSWPWRGALSP